jgi:hypothetical protein
MMTHDEMIAVIQHHRDGGKVECTIRNGIAWVDAAHLGLAGFDFSGFDYRAKPEPTTLWLELDKNQLVIASYKNRTIAQYGGTIKKFQEATE